MKLVILESPTKTKALTKYLGSDFLVLSSNGHISKLSKKGQYHLGIDLDTFNMNFEIDEYKKRIVERIIKESKKADEIYIATDPDREGEAIAYHIKKILPIDKKIYRVIFNEITLKVVKKAFENPGELNLKLVESQLSRRALDRILGFRLSWLLQKKIYSRSAGRVQSVALSFIVKREEEIKKFIPETFYSIFSILKNEKKIILINNKYEKLEFKEQKKIDNLLKKFKNKLEVLKINNKKWVKKSPIPFKTSTLLQNGISELGFSSKKIMFLAQQLYEGININENIIGLITYPRTDSTRINEDFIKNIKKEIKNNFGDEYVKKDLIKNKTKQKIQDAHEAIRITNLEYTLEEISKFLTNEQLRLYKLIYNRTFSSFMSNVEGIIYQYILKEKETESLFYLEEKKTEFYGFLKIKQNYLNNVDEKFLNWKEKDEIEVVKFEKIFQTTKPKPRYIESGIIKKMDNLGIGRPSTYASVVSKLFEREYIEKNEFKKIIPTKRGENVNEKLQKFFNDFISITYTADMEKKLDLIAEGKEERKFFLSKFYNLFDEKFKKAEKEMKNLEKIELDRNCPECNLKLQEKEGRYGKFVACSGFPKCKFIEKNITNNKNLNSEELDIKCEKCNSNMVEKIGRFGKFIACSKYPECKFILKKNKKEPKKLDKKCIKCNSFLVEREGRFGKFIACSGFPKCKYIEKIKKNK